MKFEPKTVDESVNLPERHPLADMTWLLGGFVLVFAVIYFIGGVIIDQLAARIPPEYDNKFSPDYTEQLITMFGPEINSGELFDDTQALFSRLRQHLPEEDTREYQLTLIDTNQVNAMALPGGQIVIFKGLLDQAQSQNEVAMVLAHEFGHVNHRHHWRRIARVVLFGITASVLGSPSQLQSQLANIPLATMMQANSRSHENESDRFAINLVCKFYGHSGGAVDFFERNVGRQSRANEMISFLLTHPLSQERVVRVEQRALELQCSQGENTPWPHSLP